MVRVRTGRDLVVDTGFLVDVEDISAASWDALFERLAPLPAPLVVEVGFGNGMKLVEMAMARPEVNFVGIELYGKGIVKLSRRLERENVGNVRIVRGEAYKVLSTCFADGQIAEVHINFPDPWPKLRHHKRRFVVPSLPVLLCRKVRRGGRVFMATDFDCYAFQMRDVFEAHPGFVNMEGRHRFIYKIPGRIETKYERKFAALGATIRYLHYRRIGS